MLQISRFLINHHCFMFFVFASFLLYDYNSYIKLFLIHALSFLSRSSSLIFFAFFIHWEPAGNIYKYFILVTKLFVYFSPCINIHRKCAAQKMQKISTFGLFTIKRKRNLLPLFSAFLFVHAPRLTDSSLNFKFFLSFYIFNSFSFVFIIFPFSG